MAKTSKRLRKGSKPKIRSSFSSKSKSSRKSKSSNKNYGFFVKSLQKSMGPRVMDGSLNDLLNKISIKLNEGKMEYWAEKPLKELFKNKGNSGGGRIQIGGPTGFIRDLIDDDEDEINELREKCLELSRSVFGENSIAGEGIALVGVLIIFIAINLG